MNYKNLTIISILTAATFLSACGDAGGDNSTKDAKAQEREVAADIMRSAAGTAVGAATGFGVSTADLPDFAEVMPGAKAIHNMKTDSDNKIGGSVSLTSDAKPDAIVAFYKASIEKHGLKIQMENAGAQMVQIMAESEDKTRSLMVMIVVADDGKPTINLIHSRPKA